MAEKRKKQTAVFGTNQPRDENRTSGHDVQRSEQKQKSGQNKRKTGQYRKEDTFGQSDQKSGNMDTSKNQKSDFSQENNAFTEENVSEQEKASHRMITTAGILTTNPKKRGNIAGGNIRTGREPGLLILIMTFRQRTALLRRVKEQSLKEVKS